MPMSLRNDAFGFKKAERLPDGRAADAEFLGEQLLEKPVAGPVFPERNLGMKIRSTIWLTSFVSEAGSGIR